MALSIVLNRKSHARLLPAFPPSPVPMLDLHPGDWQKNGATIDDEHPRFVIRVSRH